MAEAIPDGCNFLSPYCIANLAEGGLWVEGVPLSGGYGLYLTRSILKLIQIRDGWQT
jgi:hypothetical protein